jgi:isochorismate synthase
MFTWEGGRTWLTANVLVGPLTDPKEAAAAVEQALESLVDGQEIPRHQPASRLWEETSPEEWRRCVEAALQAIRGGKLSKVVLARRKRLRAVAPFSLEAALGSLEEAYPGCAVFAMERGGSCFLGASPESLVQLQGGEVSLACMAGTTARGESADADDTLAGALLANSKERREHAAVVEQVAFELRELCQELCWEAQPKVVRLRGVQHLATAFFGRALEGKDILDMVAALHPTPAVGGAPKAAALEFIRRLEGDRGWYAAPIGWLDAQGQGEFWVGIRSALVQGSQATLYAGAGIVEGSDPEEERQETELKFQPLLKALGRA